MTALIFILLMCNLGANIWCIGKIRKLTPKPNTPLAQKLSQVGKVVECSICRKRVAIYTKSGSEVICANCGKHE